MDPGCVSWCCPKGKQGGGHEPVYVLGVPSSRTCWQNPLFVICCKLTLCLDLASYPVSSGAVCNGDWQIPSYKIHQLKRQLTLPRTESLSIFTWPLSQILKQPLRILLNKPRDLCFSSSGKWDAPWANHWAAPTLRRAKNVWGLPAGFGLSNLQLVLGNGRERESMDSNGFCSSICTWMGSQFSFLKVNLRLN